MWGKEGSSLPMTTIRRDIHQKIIGKKSGCAVLEDRSAKKEAIVSRLKTGLSRQVYARILRQVFGGINQFHGNSNTQFVKGSRRSSLWGHELENRGTWRSTREQWLGGKNPSMEGSRLGAMEGEKRGSLCQICDIEVAKGASAFLPEACGRGNSRSHRMLNGIYLKQQKTYQSAHRDFYDRGNRHEMVAPASGEPIGTRDQAKSKSSTAIQGEAMKKGIWEGKRQHLPRTKRGDAIRPPTHKSCTGGGTGS